LAIDLESITGRQVEIRYDLRQIVSQVLDVKRGVEVGVI
jgi:hypothetical protein